MALALARRWPSILANAPRDMVAGIGLAAWHFHLQPVLKMSPMVFTDSK
jgi:hypothetical protein